MRRGRSHPVGAYAECPRDVIDRADPDGPPVTCLAIEEPDRRAVLVPSLGGGPSPRIDPDVLHGPALEPPAGMNLPRTRAEHAVSVRLRERTIPTAHELADQP